MRADLLRVLDVHAVQWLSFLTGQRVRHVGDVPADLDLAALAPGDGVGVELVEPLVAPNSGGLDVRGTKIRACSR